MDRKILFFIALAVVSIGSINWLFFANSPKGDLVKQYISNPTYAMYTYNAIGVIGLGMLAFMGYSFYSKSDLIPSSCSL